MQKTTLNIKNLGNILTQEIWTFTRPSFKVLSHRHFFFGIFRYLYNTSSHSVDMATSISHWQPPVVKTNMGGKTTLSFSNWP